MNNEEWLKRTNEIITEWENERQSLHDKYDQLASELMDLDQRIESGHELISAYMNKYHIESTTPSNVVLGNLAKKSYPEMLIEIAKQSNGILNIADTTDILFKAGISSDKKAITHNISNSLWRMRNFKKIGRGQYRFTNHIQTRSRKGRVKTGVKQAVKNLKEQNPLMSMPEVLDHLVKSNFNFKNKRPVQSVNMAWVALGYAREGKQQKLLIPPSSNPA